MVYIFITNLLGSVCNLKTDLLVTVEIGQHRNVRLEDIISGFQKTSHSASIDFQCGILYCNVSDGMAGQI